MLCQFATHFHLSGTYKIAQFLLNRLSYSEICTNERKNVRNERELAWTDGRTSESKKGRSKKEWPWPPAAKSPRLKASCDFDAYANFFHFCITKSPSPRVHPFQIGRRKRGPQLLAAEISDSIPSLLSSFLAHLPYSILTNRRLSNRRIWIWSPLSNSAPTPFLIARISVLGRRPSDRPCSSGVWSSCSWSQNRISSYFWACFESIISTMAMADSIERWKQTAIEQKTRYLYLMTQNAIGLWINWKHWRRVGGEWGRPTLTIILNVDAVWFWTYKKMANNTE